MVNYYFTIQLIAPRPGLRERVTHAGSWIPPKARGNNAPRSLPNPFEYNGHQTIPLDELPGDLDLYKTYSVYCGRGMIWAVPYDAATMKVHNGIDFLDDEETDDDSDGEELRQDWEELSFGGLRDDTKYLSYAAPMRESQTLLQQRDDQQWAHYFIPDRYHKRPRTRNERYGGLVGELPLLIGLVAMSLPPQHLHLILPHIVANPWRLPPTLEAIVPRASQWIEQRGLVIKVYHDNDETPRRELRRYERGEYGPIFP